MRIKMWMLPFKTVNYKRTLNQKSDCSFLKSHETLRESRINATIRSSKINNLNSSE